MWPFLFFLFANAAKGHIDFAHLANEFYSRVVVSNFEAGALSVLPDIVWFRDRAEGNTADSGEALQNCYVYTMWFAHAAQNLKKFLNETSIEKKNRFETKEGTRCKDKVTVIMDTDASSIKMTLFLVLDTYGRRIRVQSAMNFLWNEENGIWWTKLRENKFEYFYTQDLEEGYTFSGIYCNGNDVYVMAKGRWHMRLFRLKIFMDEKYHLRPYLVWDEKMDIDRRIFGVERVKVVIVNNLYINFLKDYHCPWEVMNDANLPPNIEQLCRDHIEKTKNLTKNQYNSLNSHGFGFAPFHTLGYQSNAPKTKYTGFVFQLETGSLTVPLLALQTNLLVGINSKLDVRDYCWIGEDFDLRLKCHHKTGDQVSVVTVDIDHNSHNKNRNYCGRGTNWHIVKISAFKLSCFEMQRACERLQIKRDRNKCLQKIKTMEDRCERQNYTDADRNRYVQSILDEGILINTTTGEMMKQCDLPHLLHRISSRKFLNEEHFHSRMAHPHVNYRPQRHNYRSQGYFSGVLWIFLGITTGLSTIFIAEYCVRNLWKKTSRNKRLYTSSTTE